MSIDAYFFILLLSLKAQEVEGDRHLCLSYIVELYECPGEEIRHDQTKNVFE